MIFRAAKIHFSNDLAKFLNQILLFLRIIIYCRKVHKKGKEIRKYFFLPFFMEICWFFKEKPLSLHSE